MINTAEISAIIFDFGGVLIDIDYSLAERAFERLGAKDFKKLYAQAAQHGMFDDFEVGSLSPDEWRSRVRQVTGLSLVSDGELNSAWNAMIIGMSAEKETLLLALKERLPVCLLSNTNQIHEDFFTDKLSEHFGYNPLPGMFHGVYLSHRIGLRKPNREAFEFVLNQHNLSASTTLFIDDSIQHVMGARQAGLQAYHYQGESLQTLLSPFLGCKTQ